MTRLNFAPHFKHPDSVLEDNSPAIAPRFRHNTDPIVHKHHFNTWTSCLYYGYRNIVKGLS